MAFGRVSRNSEYSFRLVSDESALGVAMETVEKVELFHSVAMPTTTLSFVRLTISDQSFGFCALKFLAKEWL